jgi:hypothetical protein
MGERISDTIVAEQDGDGHWYLRDTTANLISRECFISVAIIQKCFRQGHEVTWMEHPEELLPVD